MKTIILGPPGTGNTTTLLNLVDDFYGWAKRNNWELDRQKTASLIKNLSNFEKEVRMKIKQQTPHVIKIKSMKIESDEEPEISEVKYEQSPF